ncbi:MAG: beta-galactosidase [Sphingobacteriaceae bacterium]|nr:beta-galactosidase [Sphingobacteriaceae bacterium]
MPTCLLQKTLVLGLLTSSHIDGLAQRERGARFSGLNGKPYLNCYNKLLYVCLPKAGWKKCLQITVANGLSTVSAYFAPNRAGQFIGIGKSKVTGFCKVVKEIGLYLILRPVIYRVSNRLYKHNSIHLYVQNQTKCI